MNISYFNIPFRNKVLSTYSVGKYAKTLYEKGSSNSENVAKSRNGIIISISDDAKALFAKAKQVKYQHGTPIEKKKNATSSVFEKIDGNFFRRKANSSRFSKKKATKPKFDFEHYISLEKMGFVISGIPDNESNQTEVEPSQKLKDLFEIESLREPGSLVNVLV